MELLQPSIQKNDRSARWLIWALSFTVFAAVVLLSRVKLNVDLGFDKHLFAKLNAGINSIVTLFLIAGLVAVKAKNYLFHKRLMLSAILLSCVFLISYICHHLFAGETKYGG